MAMPNAGSDALFEVIETAARDRECELDDEIRRLDNMKEDDLEELRRKRLEQMKSSHANRQKKLAQGFGEYELIEERDFFKVAKESEYMVVHFYRPATWRCEILDNHLKIIAKRHYDTRFVKLDAEKSQYLAEKLHIWCLPSMVLCKNGKTDHTIVGFSEFQNGDEAKVEDVEELLSKYGVIHLD